MKNSLTVIVPTIGRRTLPNTLLSFAEDVLDGDRVFVVCDGPQAGVSFLVGYFDSAYSGEWSCVIKAEQGCWGHPIRNQLLGEVSTDYVWTIDDDDVGAPGALAAMRDQTSPWTIYRMSFGDGHPARGIICWREKVLQHGDIGTPMVVSRPSGARFGHDYSGDWGYVQALRDEFGEPAWDERVIAIIRP